MTNSTGSGSSREYTVSEDGKKRKKGKIRPKNWSKLTKKGKNDQKGQKDPPSNSLKRSFLSFLRFLPDTHPDLAPDPASPLTLLVHPSPTTNYDTPSPTTSNLARTLLHVTTPTLPTALAP
jgi:hypothetical protein